MATMFERIRWLQNRSRRYVGVFGLTTGVWYALRDMPRASGEVTLQWPGYAHPFRIRFGGSDLRTFLHVIVDRGYELPWDISPKVIIDGGANVGYSAAYFANRYPDSLVIAIEPDAENFRLLRENTRGYAGVRPLRAALWGHAGKVNLVDPGHGPWGFRIQEGKGSAVPGGGGVDDVAAVDVPTLLRDFGVDSIDFLKLDVEGSEREIFQHSEAWIGKVSAIAVELHDRFQPGCTEAFEVATTGFTHRSERGEDVFVARTV